MKNWLTPQQFAALAGVHVQTIRQRIKDGKLIAVWVGAGYRIPFEEWEKQRTEGLTPKPPISFTSQSEDPADD